MSFQAAQQVADAVLYEGYVLYPYRASSDKNRLRFQFGVVAPRAQAEADGGEAWEMQTECLATPAPGAAVSVRVRFLRLRRRRVEGVAPDASSGHRIVDRLDGPEGPILPWDEAEEEAIGVDDVALDALLSGEVERAFTLSPTESTEPVRDAADGTVGRLVRTTWPIEGRMSLSAEAVGDVVRLRVRVENLTPWSAPGAPRDEVLARSLVGCHTMLALTGGRFLSLTDPPPAAADAAAGSRNHNTWPVLVGDDDRVVLSSPIILPDHPQIAPESPGDLFDATEIDEILTLRIMTLTDEEQREARATDPRARRILERATTMPPEMLARLHGAIRELRPSPPPPAGAARPGAAQPSDSFGALMADPFGEQDDRFALPASTWEPRARVPAHLAIVVVDGVEISKGSSVRLRPNRRADAMDAFLAGRLATVEAVFESVDDEISVAVTIDDDPATELHRAYGRFFYFSPDELEPTVDRAGMPS